MKINRYDALSADCEHPFDYGRLGAECVEFLDGSSALIGNLWRLLI
jgi:hypothetical protein